MSAQLIHALKVANAFIHTMPRTPNRDEAAFEIAKALVAAAAPAAPVAAPSDSAVDRKDALRDLVHIKAHLIRTGAPVTLLTRLEWVRALLAGNPAVAPAAPVAAPAKCKACDGTRCAYTGPVGDPPEECNACFDQSPSEQTYVTLESALQALEHLNQSNSTGREVDARAMLIRVTP